MIWFQEVAKTRKRRIAQAVAVWIRVAKLQVVKDAGKNHIIFVTWLDLTSGLALSPLCSVPGSPEGAAGWAGTRRSH